VSRRSRSSPLVIWWGGEERRDQAEQRNGQSESVLCCPATFSLPTTRLLGPSSALV
jgi:hypothetical protein